MKARLARWAEVIPWLLLLIWFLLPTMSVIGQIQRGEPLPADLATYYRAAERLRAGEPLYETPDEARSIWLTIHALERANYLADINAASAANIPGPYVYLPALAIWIYWLGLQPAICMALIYLAVIGVGLIWHFVVRTQAAPAWATIPRSSGWLLIMIGSPALLLSLSTTGNIEPVLIFVTLVATLALWRGQPFLSSPLIAFIVLVKPFYALLFIAFGLLLFANPAHPRGKSWSRVSATLLLSLLIIAIAVVTWGRLLWQPTLDFVRNAFAYHWFVLPIDQQTPLSIWNRTPLQGLINLGVMPQRAQQLAFGSWGFMLLLTFWLTWGRRIALPLTFALALVLLYWGRPVGWSFLFLEIVVILAAWPTLYHWQRGLLLIAVLALMTSHWLALIWTLQGVWLRLVTMQSASLPWESWLVLPLAWLALIAAARNEIPLPTSTENADLVAQTPS